ncbi:hypothetical protein, variant [Sphaeroforma arctica JP610]|uniref:Uncharacterized protein n=1 Tax=Sphaeroforma arctica JP610 TaxID=667725 RepID=A0A0L0G689_9EUKA|nr:hypothetical protein, variant [Sphaeroforma arctica JP610]KNC84381.1 hypothetical protein, variant [Sphaeroforma arctica JP610]|eukprot:XP_014158283.1 hypothetical protein, variant [Sphaeroforma arctica JP610]
MSNVRLNSSFRGRPQSIQPTRSQPRMLRSSSTMNSQVEFGDMGRQDINNGPQMEYDETTMGEHQSFGGRDEDMQSMAAFSANESILPNTQMMMMQPPRIPGQYISHQGGRLRPTLTDKTARDDCFIKFFLSTRQFIETLGVIISFAVSIFIDLGNVYAQKKETENVFDPAEDNDNPYLIYAVIANVYGIFLLLVSALVGKMFGNTLAKKHYCVAVMYFIITALYLAIVVVQAATAVIFFLDVVKPYMDKLDLMNSGSEDTMLGNATDVNNTFLESNSTSL